MHRISFQEISLLNGCRSRIPLFASSVTRQLPILVLALIPRSAVGQSEALGLLEYQLPPLQPLLAKGSINEGSAPEASLPSFEAVCHLQCATIRHIPQKARPSFARVFSDSLRSVCVSNSEEAWLKLFMLPKCVLRASLRGGHKLKSHSVEELLQTVVRWSPSFSMAVCMLEAQLQTIKGESKKQSSACSLQGQRRCIGKGVQGYHLFWDCPQYP